MTAAPNVTAADAQVVTHHVGDVTCILMVPADCPVPDVALYVHPGTTTPDERAVAVSALGLTSRPTKRAEESIWRKGEGDGWSAVVFLLPGDEDAQVTA